MRYFGGFGFSDDMALFDEIIKSYNLGLDYNILGFSYGAQKALSYALESKDRVEHLILFSPAFFNDKNEDFKRGQILAFKKNQKLYMRAFLNNIGFSTSLESYLKAPAIDELESLLNYRFDEDSMLKMVEKGIKLSVFLGGRDRIIDVESAASFFSKYGVVYLFKEANHLLR